jgi:hypothetical protein
MAGTPGRTDNDGDYEAMICRALTQADGLDALYDSYRALRAAAVKEYRRRPAEAGLIMAQLAASFLHFARVMPQHHPERPPGCAKVPRPDDLLAAFWQAMAQAQQTAGGAQEAAS